MTSSYMLDLSKYGYNLTVAHHGLSRQQAEKATEKMISIGKSYVPKKMKQEENEILDRIATMVYKKTSVPIDLIRSPSRAPIIVEARFAFAYLAWMQLDKRGCFLKIGNYINRDRTTVYHAIETVENCFSLPFKNPYNWIKGVSSAKETDDNWCGDGMD